MPFDFSTDGSGVITGGTWTGDGTVQPNIVAGSFSGPATATVQFPVTNFTSGTLGINGIGGNVYSSNRILTNPLIATHQITLTGGNADLRMHNSNSFDGGNLLFNSIGLTDFSGVTEISWTTTYSAPIAGRNSDTGSLLTRPMGQAFALLNAGTGNNTSSFQLDLAYNQIYRQTSPGVFVTGVGSATPFQSTEFGTAVAGATSFTANAFPLNKFILVRGYDVDGGGFGASDTDDIYMRQLTWTLRKDDNTAFAANTVFVFSMDGQQYANHVDVIPEPSSILLIGGSLIGGFLHRRRRA